MQRASTIVCRQLPCVPEHTPREHKVTVFPPNVTSKGQPLNQGIIANFKTHYKNEIQLRTVRAPNVGVRQSKLALCECLFATSNAWSNTVKASTIQHCFRKAGFKLSNNKLKKSLTIPWIKSYEFTVCRR